MQIYLVVALIFAISVATFAVQNATSVDIKFLVYEFRNISLVIVIFLSALFGSLTFFLISLVKQLSNIKQIKFLENQVKELEKKLEQSSQAESNKDTE